MKKIIVTTRIKSGVKILAHFPRYKLELNLKTFPFDPSMRNYYIFISFHLTLEQ